MRISPAEYMSKPTRGDEDGENVYVCLDLSRGSPEDAVDTIEQRQP